MTDLHLQNSIFGILPASSNDCGFATARANLEASEARLLLASESDGLLSCWRSGSAGHHVDPSKVSVVVVGSPRLRQSDTGGIESLDLLARHLAELYQRDRDELPNAISGDFALAVLDHRDRSALLAIDRVGIRTMAYTRLAHGGFAFATDPGLLTRLLSRERRLAAQAVYDYTYFHAVPAPLTIYDGVFKLPAAHAVRHAAGEQRIMRYWTPTFASGTTRSAAELGDEVMSTLRGAVSRSLSLAGPRAGGFLSGGLDSSTVCGLMAKARDEAVPAISVGFEQEGYDEVSYARVAANHFGLRHCVHYITPDEIADAIPQIADAYPEPFGNSSAVPTYICAVTARAEGLESLLAGDGGDELFGGNSRYVTQQIFELYGRVPAALRRSILDPLFGTTGRAWQIGPLRKAARYVQQARIPLPERMHSYNLLQMQSPEALFERDFLARVDTSHPTDLTREEYFAADAGSDSLARMLMHDWRFTLADNDLRKVTRMCELGGIGVRFPLLEDEVIEVSTRIPSEWKIKGYRLRDFYKRTLDDFLPREIIKKSKHGFGLPFGEWLLRSARLQEMVYDALTDLRGRAIYSNDFLDALIEDHRQSHAAFYGNMVWVLAMLEWWLAAQARRDDRPLRF